MCTAGPLVCASYPIIPAGIRGIATDRCHSTCASDAHASRPHHLPIISWLHTDPLPSGACARSGPTRWPRPPRCWKNPEGSFPHTYLPPLQLSSSSLNTSTVSGRRVDTCTVRAHDRLSRPARAHAEPAAALACSPARRVPARRSLPSTWPPAAPLRTSARAVGACE